MNRMNITAAQYISSVNVDGSSNGENVAIKITIDGTEMFVPIASGNRHYDEIMKQVAAGELTIQEAD